MPRRRSDFQNEYHLFPRDRREKAVRQVFDNTGATLPPNYTACIPQSGTNYDLCRTKSDKSTDLSLFALRSNPVISDKTVRFP